MQASEAVVPAGKGAGLSLAQGRTLEIVNIHGSQVVDFWAFRRDEPSEYVSMQHCRSCLEKLHFTRGDALYSNRRRKLLEIVGDTSPGIHDSLLSACDAERYRLLGVSGYHANCADNLRGALEEFGITIADVPAPWNIFENVAAEEGRLEIRPPLSKAGDSVSLRALDDLIVVLSACPMDVVPTNGADCKPRPVSCRIA
jgi:uncharacterized protein YcgI (DUF1989 family)